MAGAGTEGRQQRALSSPLLGQVVTLTPGRKEQSHPAAGAGHRAHDQGQRGRAPAAPPPCLNAGTPSPPLRVAVQGTEVGTAA